MVSFGNQRGSIFDIPIRKVRCEDNKVSRDAFVCPVQDRWVGSNNEDFRVHKVHDRDRDAIDVEEHPTSTKSVLTVINSDTSNPYVGQRHVNDGVRLASPVSAGRSVRKHVRNQ